MTKQYEFAVVDFDFRIIRFFGKRSKGIEKYDPDGLENRLESLGLEGWEIRGASDSMLYLQREITPAGIILG